jgi:tRNA-specific 2-thiouridylase
MIRMIKRKKTVAIALSGGMDSFYAARVLKDEGWDVVGIHLLIPIPPQEGTKKIKALGLISTELGIPLFFLDVKKYFQERVIDYFITSYCLGITPNPCVVCNHLIKFEQIIAWIDERGIDYLATGHYARVGKNAHGGYLELLKGRDRQKDQAYFLHRLGQSHLSRTVFPLGDMTKVEVYHKSEGRGLLHSFHSESQEICFIPDNDYRAVVKRQIKEEQLSSGDIIDLNGNVLGVHSGTFAYTIGQRHGIGVASGEPLYVCEIKPERNEIVVAPRERLFSTSLTAEEFHWIGHQPDKKEIRVQAQIRYRHEPADAVLTMFSKNVASCEFDEPQWAITPGQALVCYDGERVLGGGWIKKKS